MDSNNVVMFPRKNTLPMTEDQYVGDVINYKEGYLTLIADDTVDFIIGQLTSLGFDIIMNDDVTPDILLLRESITSLLMRASGLEYPLHDLTDELFNTDEIIEESEDE